jgi:putative ABC transport system permease protein
MLKNYFIIAWRNLLRSKWYSFINTFGLSIGMAVALLIGLWVWDEMTYNRYHPNHERLAQVMTTQTFNGHTGTGPAVSIPIAKELRTNYAADFSQVTQATWSSDHILAIGDKKLSQEGMYVEPAFPEMLTLRMLQGSRDALKDPSSILLTKSLASSLFGEADPMNKTIRVDNTTNLKVAGVYEDLPRNTTLYREKFFMAWRLYASLNPWVDSNTSNWGNHSWQLFVQLSPNVDAARTTAKIKDIAKPHNKDGGESIILQPMDNWHLYSDFKDGKVSGGRIRFVWLFSIIGVFVLLLACINFMNLSTARSEKRAKEVGIRKTVGSLRHQLIAQFLSESLVVALLAFILAIGWVLLSLSAFNTLADKDIHLPWNRPLFWLLTLGFTFFTGLVSGSYPAFYLSGFQPIKVLKGTFRAGRYASLPRKVLVVLQFTVSVSLIIGTVLVFRQVRFAQSRPVGYTREGLISINMTTPEIRGHYDALRNDLLKTNAVEDMSESSGPVTNVWSNQIGFEWKGKDPNSVPLFGISAVTHDYGRTIGWQIIEGRDFSRSFPTDSGGAVAGAASPSSSSTAGAALILNESAVRLTGLRHPVGEIVKWNKKDHPIIGVVRDMVMESPYMPVKPMIFFLDYGWTEIITVRLKPSMTTASALAAIRPVFSRYDPGSPFEYKFVDDEFERKFSDEQRIGHLATVFAVLAVFISCLGLFGLASFVAEQRIREIGVRKVLGASLFHLWRLLSTDFVILVIISCAIAIPVSGYFLHGWLQQYEYRTPLSWWIFAAASLGALAITLLTVSYQAIRAALMNPVTSLRTE